MPEAILDDEREEHWEYSIDATITRELGVIHEQAAKETGQVQPGTAVNVSVQPTILREFRVVTDVPLAPEREPDDGADSSQ